MILNESIAEAAALVWFGELGYPVGHGPHIAPGESAVERASFAKVVLVGHMHEAIFRLNPAIPSRSFSGLGETLRSLLLSRELAA